MGVPKRKENYNLVYLPLHFHIMTLKFDQINCTGTVGVFFNTHHNINIKISYIHMHILHIICMQYNKHYRLLSVFKLYRSLADYIASCIS